MQDRLSSVGGFEMRTKFGTSVLILLLLSGCASIEAGDEVKSLQESSSTFADALKAADTENRDSHQAWKRETYRTNMLSGAEVRFTQECFADIKKADDDLIKAIGASPYDRSVADAAFYRLQVAGLCDVPSVRPPRMPTPILPSEPFELGAVMASGSNSLSGTARKLDAYVETLADVATGETAAKTDEARSKLVTAGAGLLGALGVGGTEPYGNLINSIFSSVLAAKRNEATRKFLDKMDSYMPTLMERVGLAARIAHSGAARNRADSTLQLAKWANTRLNASDMFRKSGRARVATQARVDLYDETTARLAVHNDALLRLMSSDPMAAARAFAEAHRGLRDVYHDPRASRAALAKGLADFQDAATALHDALKDAPAE